MSGFWKTCLARSGIECCSLIFLQAIHDLTCKTATCTILEQKLLPSMISWYNSILKTRFQKQEKRKLLAFLWDVLAWHHFSKVTGKVTVAEFAHTKSMSKSAHSVKIHGL